MKTQMTFTLKHKESKRIEQLRVTIAPLGEEKVSEEVAYVSGAILGATAATVQLIGSARELVIEHVTTATAPAGGGS